ncbi:MULTISPECIES: C-terminal binding protein [Geobacillus]|jgi:D-3-phosphoglycerate dehydrogenase|uniref:C-terminal binding protein n=1 Tax=Geobacillus thermodenitrificans TaxID=33940 RepID=A0ABY9Q942_GEOTD|nr:C-terminal binding protein [Geobacillus thermodenitrificans]ARP43008.1 D-3-phosphoglycerate dehydrogenase [Geobacillus thermodenitrificans]MEC5186916.1 D-3-phosphoglycerate dehydrogenase [Geobacillus thermodenitrificans]MED0661992.1 C-terminal binding protein [Geobacillus thermodenitrificans]MED3905317.1 C-terminal binding protein [Geobacillus thermodenitrificans]MED4917370.1 C-terminal binding protein [Geobacillus thermodenitrificans]
MKKYKVVVTDYEFQTLKPEQEVLSPLNVDFVVAQCYTEEEVIAVCKDADAIINQYAPISAKVIDQLEKCKVISRYGVGVNTVDVDAATEKGIIVANVTDYSVDEVSDHALALLLSLARKIVKLNDEVKSGVWNFNVGKPIYRLRGRTLGLVGFGRIPQALAKKAQSLGLYVIAYDPYIPAKVARQFNVHLVELNDLFRQSDYISVHAPLTKETKGMISDEQFHLAKKELIIVNTARGPVIDESSLIRALQDGKISGAGLDVTEYEPIHPDNPLLQMENVVITPHIAWYSEESEMELKRKTAQNVADVLSGCYPRYLVNPRVKEKVRLKVKESYV